VGVYKIAKMYIKYANSALLFRCMFREYYEVVADSYIGKRGKGVKVQNWPHVILKNNVCSWYYSLEYLLSINHI
jgi:hypothetical protein